MFLMSAVCAAIVAAILYIGLIGPFCFYIKDEKGLRRFDGPLLARLSNWWIAYTTFTNARSTHVLAAHRQYGPVIRIQPEHLSFSEPRAIADIYSFQSRMVKSEFYESFSGPDHTGKNIRSIINTRDRDAHSRKRRLLASAFAQKNIVQMEPVLREVLIRLMNAFDGFCARPPAYSDAPREGFLDLYKWVNLFTYDAIGELGFGRSFGFIERGDDLATCEKASGKQYKAHIIEAFQSSSLYDTFMASWSNIVHPLKSWTWFLKGGRCGAVFGDLVYNKVRQRIESGKPSTYRDLFESFITGKEGKKEIEFSEILRESNVLIAAGNDTSGTAIAHCMFMLIKHPEAMARLREELAPVMANIDDGPAIYSRVKDLKYLRACIDEALRLRPALPPGLPREVPKGGAQIAGHLIAEGVAVSVPAYTVHRDPQIYPEPESFKPERWLTEDKVLKNAMHGSFIAFSTGPRGCIGRNLAYFEQQMLIATLVHRYAFEMVSPDYDLPIVERLNANPAQFWVSISRRSMDSVLA